MYGFSAGVIRRFTATVANINAAVGATANAVTLTFALPNGSFTSAEVNSGIGGVVTPTANASNLVFSSLVVTATNAATCKVANPSNAVINAVNAALALSFLIPAGSSGGAATGTQS